MVNPDVQAPGFFGKVPARGDFLGRRVPLPVREAWEDWLANLVTAAKAAPGLTWPDDWLTAPVWHFVLGAGLAPPSGAAGVLVASADRVGRLFPFAVIGAAAGDRGSLDAWARAAEALTLDALNDGFDPEALDHALVALGVPPAIAGPARATGQWALEFDGDWPSGAEDAFAPHARHLPGPDQSAWWCRGSARVRPMHFRCAGLPGPALSAAMVAGGFDLSLQVQAP